MKTSASKNTIATISERQDWEVVNVDDACSALGSIGKTLLYDLMRRKELVRKKVGRRTVVVVGSIRAYLERLPQDAA